jgi:hypothetical protein
MNKQWNFTQPQGKMKIFLSQVNGWKWRTSSYVKLARLRKPKAVCSLLYVEYSPKTNAQILCDTGHTKVAHSKDRASEGS